ncbi:MAG: hypothetical protein P4L41_15370 [Flavipsychrobacter sp.]|nr:hypothetical protein [Flavipsychrobacter sp.]
MKRFITCCLLVLMCGACYGQRYSHVQIMEQADSILSAKMGTLFHYCLPDDKGSYYSYEKKKKEHFKKLGKGMTCNHFMSVAVHYNFVMPYPKCPCMDTITEGITVYLDTALHLIEDIDKGFVPRFAIDDDSCRFITKEKAIEIALQQKLHYSISEPYAYIHSTALGRDYAWIVLRTIWNEKNTSGHNTVKDDMVIIDALTGEVKENKVIPYAPHVY